MVVFFVNTVYDGLSHPAGESMLAQEWTCSHVLPMAYANAAMLARDIMSRYLHVPMCYANMDSCVSCDYTRATAWHHMTVSGL